MPKTNCQPSRPHTFNLTRSPLAGFNLIDASAGTGKTYTICSLVLRLLLEKELTIEQILVVTYTEAATEDLRDRIRQKLRHAILAVTNGQSDDAFLQEYLSCIDDYKTAEKCFSDALRSFDEAAIFTIHGFCQRMLIENSFESNALFDTELVADASYLIREIIEDFWRQSFYQSPKLFSEYAAAKISPDALHDFLGIFIPHPSIKFIPAIEYESAYSKLSDSESEYIDAYNTVCRLWPEARNEVSQDLLNSKALNRNKYRMATIPGLLTSMDAMAAADHSSPYLFDKFTKLSSSSITSGTKTKEIPHILPFYGLCEELVRSKSNLHIQYDRCLLAMKKRLSDSFMHEFNLRKKRDNIYSFEDLLQRLHKTLSGPSGSFLAETIARKYPAALIDEFQDTDPLQFEIFKAICKEKSLLFLIGDPKQAIYSFRGADIFTYMDAAAGTSLAHHTLGVNHRSTPALVKAINTIFCRVRNPFIFEAISFQPVSAAQKQDPEYLNIDGRQEEPFILWHLRKASAAGNDKNITAAANSKVSKTAARRIIISRVAAEVTRLLNLAAENRICINGRKLLPGDIAILVRKNDEAGKMQQALVECQVPSVVHSGDDLFTSEEAKEMILLLSAVITPSNFRKVKTALLTRLIGLHGNKIEELQVSNSENEKIIAHWLSKFRTYHGVWKRHGFIQMFWNVMQENHVRARLLATDNGERSLTNVLHLAEILHQEAVSRGLNMSALLGYLQDRLAEEKKGNIEHQLRLESDEDRVKIVTIHKAKGLEYSVVFCPFTWEGSRLNPKRGCLFHQPQDGSGTELVFDAGSPELDKHLQTARYEEMAENLRLLYVALTRAVHRCYLVWGQIKGAETSAPAYLMHQRSSEVLKSGTSCSPDKNLIKNVADRFPGLSDQQILADLQELAIASEGTIKISSVEELPQTFLYQKHEGTALLQHRTFTGMTIAADWKISSFSSLTANRSSVVVGGRNIQDEASDRDELYPIQSMTADATDQNEKRHDIFSFPHGARPGSFLHELIEQADFNNETPLTENFIQEKLQYFGYETFWSPVIIEMLDNLAHVKLHKTIQDLKLSNIPSTNCLHELEFHFPLCRITPDDLTRIFSNINLDGSLIDAQAQMALHLERLTFFPARGFMRGFIDFVFEFQGKFYLTDWKSNYLGPHIDNYQQKSLQKAMLSGFYFLQYHIYCLALHLYLQERLPGYHYETHFGGVFYIFLRGINKNLGSDYGIYYDLPPLSIIENLALPTNLWVN